MRAAIVLTCLLASSTAAASGQYRDQYRDQYRAHADSAAVEFAPLTRQDASSSDSSRILGGALLAGVGSLAGLYSGAIVGAYVAAAMGATDGFSGLGAGAVIGLWLGAAIGSTTAGGKFGKSLLGSAAGMLLGSGLTTVMGEDNGAAPVAFVLTHAFTTASFGF